MKTSWGIAGVVLLLLAFGTDAAFGNAASSGQAVSFFGSSWVNMKLQEARSSSDIYFRLRTRRADSMLFLVVGRTDYCLLVLDAGRLKVHINLGAGETEVASEASFLLNDMKWHSVNLTRRGSQLTILVDNHLTKANLPGRFHELNIHFGIWLGGLGGFNEIFLGNLPSFRGCMSHITYNAEDVLLRAKSQPGQINGVSWNCSEEFEASSSDPFGLLYPNSYVISRVAISRQGTIVKMNIRPMFDDGLIFYVSGMSSRPDYLALELRKGKIRFIAELGSGPLQVQSPKNISDQQWHSVAIQASPKSLSVMVDNQSWISEPAPRGGSRHLDVSDMVYLGVEESRRPRLRTLGLMDQSFRGCIELLHIDDKAYGLPEVDVSSNVTAGCNVLDERYCIGKLSNNGSGGGTTNNRCASISGAAAGNTTGNATSTGTISSGTNSLEVITIPRDVIRIVTQTDVGELEIMRVNPLHVAEGDSVIITPRHLTITLDLSKFGIRESGVLFRISKQPQQGRIEVTTRTTGSGSTRGESFSLLDVGAGRVRYWHNGAESSRDSIELVLRLMENSGFLLPAYLQDERVLTLPVEITAVNDPPEIRLVPGSVLRLAENTRIRLMPEVITALDPDTASEELHFTVVSIGTAAAEKKGYLELSSDPGKPLRNFTQADLESGRVWYVDQGLSSSKMALKVTDGSSISQTAVLRIETFSLRIAPEVNTGLEVANVMGTAALISNSNLSFTSNAAEQGLVVEYHVVSPPKAGILQLRRTNGQWASADHFTQLDLQGGRLRYLLQRPSDMPTEDEFTFHVSLSETKVPSEFRFRLRIVSLRLEQSGSNTLSLNGTTDTPISSRSLQYRTFPLSISDQAIRYIIVDAPRFGFLQFRTQAPTNSLTLGSSPALSFTQADLVAKRVFYAFKLTPFSPMTDWFLFNVSTSHLEVTLTSGPFRCDIHHFTRKKPSSVTLKPLIVMEGGKDSISSKILRIRIAGSSSDEQPVYFNITSGPSFGVLEKERESIRLSPSFTSLNSHSSITSHYLIDRFSSLDLEKARIFYRHDGSETPRDKIELVAWNADANFMYACQLDIIVKGVNNHPPKRAPSATLSVNVVSGGMRRLSRDILNYLDEDWDSDRAALKYSTKGNPASGAGGSGIGNIYDRTISLSSPIFQWTQADVDAGKLVFKHEGTDTEGFLPYWVTDGKFTVNGTLRISAGAPWVKIVNTTSLAGKKGSMAKLSDESIQIETNLDVDQKRILIRIVGGPQHGIIRVNQTPVLNFTLGDMANRMVSYENNAVTDVQRDLFRFQAFVEGVTESELADFDIAIYPEAYWTPLKVGANGSVLVNENSSAVISQTSLHIINPHIPPTDIVYTLTKPPRHGYLAIDPSNSHEETDDYVSMWDQTVINDGRLRYVQSEPNKTHDSMHFVVTNGVQTLRDLRLDFVVIPATLILASTTVLVNEGSSIVLNLTHLHSSQNYFADKLVEVKVSEPPRYGTLAMISRPEPPIQTFPYKALQDGKIIYTHDGSETLTDQFTVVAVAQIFEDNLSGIGSSGGSSSTTRRLSLPHVVHIKVVPTNDQVPLVVNNTGTWVWVGGNAPLSNTELAAVDGDSDENHLIIYVVGTKGGFPALKDQPDTPLHNFTQSQINHSQIIFSHKGLDTKAASFDFETSDGLNEASIETFKVTVRKPELQLYDGRVKLAVFPLTQSPLRPENLLVRSSDGREINYQISSGPLLGQILIEVSENNLSPIASFTQTDVNNGKIFYQHLKISRGPKANDFIRLTAHSRFAEPLTNITVEIDISVSGAALGGLQRYVSIQGLTLKEGGQVPITAQNINFSAVTDFISMHHRGNVWKGGQPTLRLLVADVPKHGWLSESDERRLRPGAEILPSLLSSGTQLKYVHDDSETTSDQVGFSLWLWTMTTTSSSTTAAISTNNVTLLTASSSAEDGWGTGDAFTETSTWLVNITLPIQIIPINDQPFLVATPKMPIAAVVQEHWRKLTRNDLLTTDPDTPPAHIVYDVLKISHGRFVLLSDSSQSSLSSSSSSSSQSSLIPPSSSSSALGNVNPISNRISANEMENVKDYASTSRFSQADIDAGYVVLMHTGTVAPVIANLKVSDGEHPPGSIILNVPVQPLTLQALPAQSSPIRIQQGSSIMSLSLVNLHAHTNGHVTRLSYNVTRYPLHGKILLRDRTTTTSVFSHYELLRGELSYVQTDVSVANDSFEVSAHFNDPEIHRVSTTWLVNVVSVPLLRRVKEVNSFIKGFAVGGIVAPGETEFSASYGMRTTLNLAVLDASPLAVVTGANPLYEILLPPKFGQLYKITPQYHYSGGGGGGNRLNSRYKREESSSDGLGDADGMVRGDITGKMEDAETGQLVLTPAAITSGSGQYGRVASRFSHEDVRRGAIVYYPEIQSNEIMPARGAQADEFIFKVLAPGVQPAIGIAKFNLGPNQFYDEKPQIISDGSTDPATKRSRPTSIRDITLLVTPHMTKDSLVTIGVVIVAIATLSLFLVVGIRCTCSKKGSGHRHHHNNHHHRGGQDRGGGSASDQQRRRSSNGLNNGGADPKSNGIGIIDAYAPSTTCTMIDTCQSDSEGGLRPLMMSPLSPRSSSRHKTCTSRTGTLASDSGSWTSSGLRNEIPTPSVPQCRVTPLCNSSDSGGYSGGNSLLMCPLLPPGPICDTFSTLPEEIDPPEPYGFSYGSLPPPLDLRDCREEETVFIDFPHHHSASTSTTNTTMGGTLRPLNHRSSNINNVSTNTMTLPHPGGHHRNSHHVTQGTNTPISGGIGSSCNLSSGPGGVSNIPTTNSSHNVAQQNMATGTLRRQQQQPGKNQYWV